MCAPDAEKSKLQLPGGLSERASEHALESIHKYKLDFDSAPVSSRNCGDGMWGSLLVDQILPLPSEEASFHHRVSVKYLNKFPERVFLYRNYTVKKKKRSKCISENVFKIIIEN